MKIIPTINCGDFECVAERLELCSGFLESGDWAQIDISDGVYGSGRTWDNAAELKNFLSGNEFPASLEVHLMKTDAEKCFEDWFRAGIKRVIVQYDAVSDFGKFFEDGIADGEIGVSFGPDTDIAETKNAAAKLRRDYGIKFFQVLAVDPGPSGQEFNEKALGKISTLKEIGGIIVEVDGGIDPENGKLCKEAGADILCSGAFIFQSPNPIDSYKKLFSV